jgi:DNA polymerase-3 subunit gamma/tau
LHVELTLIKLNFLQQAIDLSVENGSVVKKKRLDGPIAFKTRSIQLLQAKAAEGNTGGSKLYVEQVPAKAPVVIPKPAQTIIQQAPAATTTILPRPIPKPVAAIGTKKNLLATLREKYGDQYAIEEVKEAEVLTMERLRQSWDAYTQILEKQLKHSSAGTFKSARIVIENDIRFTITVSAITSQKFVEQERMMLIDHLHKEFNNRAITFEVLVEAGEQEDIPAHMRLNSKQKFEHIAEQYPLVKELRDRLKLEIDY